MADDGAPTSPEQIEGSTEALKANTEAQEENAKASKVTVESLKEEIRLRELQLKGLGSANKETQKYVEAQRAYKQLVVEINKAEEENNKVKADALRLTLDQSKANADDAAKAADMLTKGDAKRDLINETIDATLELEAAQEALNARLDKYAKNIERAKKVQGGFNSALSAAGLGAVALKGGLLEITGQLKDLGIKYDAATVNLQRNTGFGAEGVQMMNEMVDEFDDLGATMEESGKIMSGLNKGFSGFVGLTAETRKALGGTVLEMSRFGVSADTSAAALDLLQRSMGKTPAQLGPSLKAFDDLAQSLVLPTGQVVEDFVKIGPKLARFGKDSDKQFEKLAKKAREMGLSIEAAFNIGETFDTFEGAADAAGKLNAQLGLQINSVQMLKADHTERIGLLQKEFKTHGKSFDGMHRRQRQAVAEMMGVDVDVAAKIFGDPVKYQEYQRNQKETAERSKQLTSIQEKLAGAVDKVIVSMSWLITTVATVVTLLANPYFAGFVGLISVISAGVMAWNALLAGIATTMGVVAGAQGLLSAVTGAGSAIQGFATKLGWGRVTALIAEAKAKRLAAKEQKELNTTTKDGGKAAAGSVGPMLALGAAIMMIGIGIGLAAYGFSILVTSFNEVANAGMALAAIGLVLVGFAFILYLLTTATLVAIGPMYALGVAMLLIGGGIAIAALGLAELVKAFATLGEVIPIMATGMLTMAPVMPMIALGIGAMGFAAWLAGSAMIAFGAAVLLMGIGLALAATSAGPLVTALNSLDTSKLGPISEAMDSFTASLLGLAAGLLSFALIMANPFGGTAIIVSILMLGASLLALGAAMSELQAAQGGMEALTKILTVTTEAPSDAFDNLDQVLTRIVEVQTKSATASVPALEAVAKAINPGTSKGKPAGAAGTQKEIKLVINERILAEVVIDIVNTKFEVDFR